MFKLLKNKYFWVGLIIILLSFTFMLGTSPNRDSISMVEKVIRDTYSPLQSRIVGFSLNWDGFNLLLSDKKVLSKQIQELEKENDNLRLENQVLREEAAEVKRLRGLLDFKAQNLNTFDLLAARVIARSPNNWHETVTIDKGEKNGIKKDMPVISPDGLVGRIESVGNNSSRVSLISAWDMAVGAILQETRDTKGIIEGIGDARSLRMVNIPYYALVKNNDQVITSGLSKIYPKGINIGTVSKVIKEPDGLLLSAYVTPFVDFDKLEEVLVITCYHADENNLDVQGDN